MTSSTNVCSPPTPSSGGQGFWSKNYNYDRERSEDIEAQQGLTKDYDVTEFNEKIVPSRERRYGRFAGCCRWIGPAFGIVCSVVCHVGFLVCVGLIIWSRRTELHTATTPGEDEPHYRVYYIIASVVAGVLYVGMLVEAAASEACQFLKSVVRDMTVDDYIRRMREARPVVRWHSLCYHYETSQQQTSTQDMKGMTSNMHHKVKVVTCQEHDAFKFTKWRDLTRDISGLYNLSIVRMECSKIFIFKDEPSKASYMDQYCHFRERNRRRDEFMEHDEEFAMPGYRSRAALCTQLSRRPWWLREAVFWVCTLFLLTWPYRLVFSHCSNKVYVVFIKELEV